MQHRGAKQLSESVVLIIGAGPAGLSAGLELCRKGAHPLVFETESQVGGLSKTYRYKDYYFDIGGHRFFTKIKEVDRLWHELLAEEFRTRPRLSRIYYHNRYFHYPLQLRDAMFGLGAMQSVRVFGSFLWARILPRWPEISFEDWVSNRFGRSLYDIFFRSYTEKVWGIPSNELSADWASQRIKDLDFVKAALNALGIIGGKGSHTLADQFTYPRLGPGQMYETMARQIGDGGGTVLLSRPVCDVVHEGGRIVAVHAGNESFEGGHLISSMPIDQLVRCMKPEPPPEVLAAAAGLRYRSIITAGVIAEQREICPDNWIYLPSPDVKAGRLQVYRNWSPDMVPVESMSTVGLEYFTSVREKLWTADDDEILAIARADLDRLGLIPEKNIVDGCVKRYEQAYPIYDIGYRKKLRTLREYLGSFANLQCIGRAGQFRYNNMDHSVMTGLFAARRIFGENLDPWMVNTDGGYLG